MDSSLKITKIDIFIIILIIVAAMASLPLAISSSSADQATKVVVYEQGKKIAAYALDKSRTVKLASGDGYCELQIKEGKALIKKSTCPNKICMKQGQISEAGQNLICAPMKFMFQVEGEQGNNLDAVNE